ncbi:MAG: 2OG-Fe(II) oxygenase [Ferruginibacter sp.]|nr:2OG-Fe(II) oxygenase [Cytophagales bacterium]
MHSTLSDQQVIFDFGKWNAALPEHAKAYASAQPYPHIVLDNFLEEWAAEKAMREFPPVKDEGWIHYVHFNEKKHGLNKTDLLPPFVRQVIGELNTPRFLSYVSQLTGIDHLLADEMLEGGGLHQSLRGGFLNVHADFTVHPHKANWRRRVNLLIYLNRDWQPDYRGDLELWDREMTQCRQKISPVFNRCVLFNTDEDSYHGLPDPITCPEDMTRKSVALYYFTEEKTAPRKRSTNYQARPGDGWKAPFIYLDKKFVALYSRVKSTLGINDDFISKILSLFSGRKK